MIRIPCLLLTFISVVFFSSAHARTWYITVDGTGDAPTIQAAIDSAGMDDTLLVGPGMYTWSNQGTGDEFGMIMIPRGAPALTILSEAGPEMTMLNGENLGRIFFYQGHYPGDPGGLTIDGFTFTSGRATQADNLVGGAFTAHLSSPVIRNCVFSHNWAQQGGAYWFGGQGSPQIIDCVFEANSGKYGGAIFIINTPYTALVSNCVIKNNNVSDHGGAIFGYNAPVYVENSIITQNTASLKGGAVALQNCPPATISHCTLYKNHASEGGGIGLVANTDLTVTHTIIAGSTLGGATWLHTNTSMTFSCSDLFGNNGGNWTGPIAGQNGVNGNFSAAPLFCDAANLDLLLDRDSPCAPGNHPDGVACEGIGALPVGCGDVSVKKRSWGAVKSMYREGP